LSSEDLVRAGIDPGAAATFVRERSLLSAEHEGERVRAAGISVTAVDDPSYPTLLKEIPTPPLLLFHRGKLPTPQDTCVAIVGTRLPTPYGKTIAYEFAAALSRTGVLVVSGLAIGIDTVAHTAAVETHGRTIAVLGCGLDIPYPSQNRLLMEHIVETGGAVLSEFPLGVPPQKFHFPLRNRIIAGLCRATLVVEGKMTSGALITAREALDQNREVFAIPGDITRAEAQGPNSLVRAGAHVALTAEDLLADLELSGILAPEHPRARGAPSDPREAQLLASLDKAPRSVDDVVHTLALPTAEVLAMLTTLELKQLVRDVGGGMYVRM
jgi:DNA processing protein